MHNASQIVADVTKQIENLNFMHITS